MLPDDPRALDLDIAVMTRGVLAEDEAHERMMKSLGPPDAAGGTPPAVEVETLIETMKHQVFRG